MDKNNKSTELSSQPIDYVTSAAKGILGAVPFAGSLLAELAGTVIPNQRIDRIVKFAQILEKRLKSIEERFIWSQLKDENFSDLLEESLRQAARSLSDERREYLASLVTNSLSLEDIEYVESKHLLQILSELNDVEIIWLKFYSEVAMGGHDEFREKHPTVLAPVVASMTSHSSVLDKKTLQDSYKEHLSRLGLLKPKFKTDSKTHMPEFDKATGGLEIRSYQIASLGRLLLRQIGLSNPKPKS
jgi:hypothetical protein